MMKTFLIALLSAALAAAAVYFSLSPEEASSDGPKEKQPLYWVAPMDPNFKSDKPGKSPMGMDLVPVFEEPESTVSPGTVQLSGQVRNQLSIQTQAAEWGALPINLQAAGFLEFDESSLLHVHPRVEGWLEQFWVQFEGEYIEKGQPLYAIYSPELVNAQEEYLLALSGIEPRLIRLAEERLAAFQISPHQIHQLKQSREVQQAVTMHAAQSGYVQRLQVRKGMFVKPELELLTLAQLDEVWVQAEIPERQSAQVSLGAQVTMQVSALPGKNWQGQVDYIYPDLSPQTRTLKVRIRFENPAQELKPNMLASLSIAAKPRAEQVLIPQQALIRDGSQQRVVLAQAEGEFRSVPVTAGLGNGEQIEILSGLEAGQKVVVSGQFLIDSESNLSGAESRLNPADNVDHVWVTVAVRDVREGEVTLAHPPIESWGWPKMVMDFKVKAPESTQGLKPVHYIRAKLSKAESGDYWVSEFDRESMEPVFPDQEPDPEEDLDKLGPNVEEEQAQPAHSNHQQMDHSNHQQMDHSNHTQMDHSSQPEVGHSGHEATTSSDAASKVQSSMEHSMHSNTHKHH